MCLGTAQWAVAFKTVQHLGLRLEISCSKTLLRGSSRDAHIEYDLLDHVPIIMERLVTQGKLNEANCSTQVCKSFTHIYIPGCDILRCYGLKMEKY